MVRTVISLDDDEKAWLDAKARHDNVPMTAVVREAIRQYRVREQGTPDPQFQQLLRKTRGTWKHGDGLAFQRRLRGEWESR